MSDRTHFSSTTRAVRAGIATDREHGAVVPPIHLSSTFAFDSFGTPRKFDYTRSGNPTRSQLADALTALEGGAGAVVTNTGLSAVTLVLQLLAQGDTVIAAHDCYGGTQRLLRSLAKRGLFNLVFIDLTDPSNYDVIVERKPRLVWVETPSNPLLRITDVRAVVAVSHAAGSLVVVDNTFLSPALQQPIALGADIVLHSTTKYLNGHSDVVGGAVVAAEASVATELGWWANCLGVTGAPFDSYLTLRGVRTLHPRIRSHLENTAAIVDALCRHPAVERVYYPGLADHPGHELARAQQKGFGAMVSFELAGGVDAVKRFVKGLECFTLAESLGGVESLIAHPATMTHASMDAEARATAGIKDSLLRLSVGIEGTEDLVRDLVTNLDAAVVTSVAVAQDIEPVEDPVDVVVLGFGAIGRELVAQVESSEGWEAAGARVRALIDRSGYIGESGGIGADRLAELREAKAKGQPLREAAGGHAVTPALALEAIAKQSANRRILVDATPADTTDILSAALSNGFDVVLANKVPLAGAQVAVDSLRRVANANGRRILNEATVGAGLPVIDTLGKLLDAGDTVLSIEGCPSGTLGFLFGELGRGERFSTALRAAIAAGYTEPDPRIDLSGLDVARKALILARAIGFRGELSDVSVEPLISAEWSALPLETFLERLEELDVHWDVRVAAARQAGNVLRYRARVTSKSISVGIVATPAAGRLGALEGTDNQFTFTTARYHANPLVITGPGAGPAVTAAGVNNDILSLLASKRNAPGQRRFATNG